MLTIVRAMAKPNSGLEIRDRLWLKIKIPNAFIGKLYLLDNSNVDDTGILMLSILVAGADVVDWLETHVEGFADKREAKRYASQMLKAGYIRHCVNKSSFSEQCYYIFGDLLAAGWYGMYIMKIDIHSTRASHIYLTRIISIYSTPTIYEGYSKSNAC